MNHPEKIPEPILEDFAVGELSLEEKHAVAEQLIAEPGGMERLATLALSNDEILKQYPSHLIAAQISTRTAPRSQSRKWGRPVVWGVFATGAAVLLFLFLYPFGNSTVEQLNQGPSEVAPYYGIKGEPQLIIHRKKGSESQKLKPNDVAGAGDLLQLMYNAGGLRYGVIFSYDGAHSITLHYPPSPGGSTAVEKGGPHSIDHSYELDNAPAYERFVFVGSNAPLNTEKIIKTAKQQLLRGDEVSFKNKKIHTNVFTLKKSQKI